MKVLYDCKSCGQVFLTWFDLHKHETVHSTVLKCDICDKTFRKENYFETHKEIHKCTICGVAEKLNSKQVCVKCDQKESQRRSEKYSRCLKDSSSRSRLRAALNMNNLLLKNR